MDFVDVIMSLSLDGPPNDRAAAAKEWFERCVRSFYLGDHGWLGSIWVSRLESPRQWGSGDAHDKIEDFLEALPDSPTWFSEFDGVNDASLPRGSRNPVRVSSRIERRDDSRSSLTCWLQVLKDDLADTAIAERIFEILLSVSGTSDPCFGRVEECINEDEANLEVVLRRTHRRFLPDSRKYLRGYSWITFCPAELVPKLGGLSGMVKSGAFVRVDESGGGGLLLQATETIAGYDDDAMLRVFEALRPVMPPGAPRRDPARPETRYVNKDAAAPDVP